MKISVITPTFNRAELLDRAIQSFIQQDYENKELIILDNGNTDDTPYVISKYLTAEKNIKVIRREVNNPRSLNSLWNNAHGDLVCQLHDDDFMTTNSLSLRVEKFIKNPMLEVVWGGANIVDINGEKKSFVCGELPDKKRILKQDYINFTTLMWRNEIKQKIMFDDDFEFNSDWMFKIRCLMECNCSYVYSAVMNYTIHPGQETHRSRLSGEHEKEMVMLKQKVKILYGI